MTKGAESFGVNDRVNHPVYGLGTISELNARHTTILFDENGRKKFVTSLVQLERSATPAPPKPVSSRKKPTKAVKLAKSAK
jgi:hypothetical protein